MQIKQKLYIRYKVRRFTTAQEEVEKSRRSDLHLARGRRIDSTNTKIISPSTATEPPRVEKHNPVEHDKDALKRPNTLHRPMTAEKME
ncbi:hypothetical protein EVAR_68619_1 [Eumeta japonica]|uniref:Uncharacterized protein n=1 Tax=Eumeta variegata TaxID=151549 RepID=A0A4C2AF06_EUMVA|nr:hypothetical protein EVAR_68619_1 [Eumeta japonica]